jgi:hypothetical protein
MPFAFKARGAVVDSKTGASPLPPDLRDESHQGEEPEDGREDFLSRHTRPACFILSDITYVYIAMFFPLPFFRC